MRVSEATRDPGYRIRAILGNPGYAPIRFFMRAAMRTCSVVHRLRMLRQFLDHVGVGNLRGTQEGSTYTV